MAGGAPDSVMGASTNCAASGGRLANASDARPSVEVVGGDPRCCYELGRRRGQLPTTSGDAGELLDPRYVKILEDVVHCSKEDPPIMTHFERTSRNRSPDTFTDRGAVKGWPAESTSACILRDEYEYDSPIFCVR